MSLALLQILHDVTRCRKFKMAADKTRNTYIYVLSSDIRLHRYNRSSANEFRDPENIGLTVGISFLSYLEAEI